MESFKDKLRLCKEEFICCLHTIGQHPFIFCLAISMGWLRWKVMDIDLLMACGVGLAMGLEGIALASAALLARMVAPDRREFFQLRVNALTSIIPLLFIAMLLGLFAFCIPISTQRLVATGFAFISTLAILSSFDIPEHIRALFRTALSATK